MSKTLEQKVEIKGAIGSSFIEAFRKANEGMNDFQKEAKAIQQELNRLSNDFRSGRIHESQYAEETQKLGAELNSLERELKDAADAQKRLAQETAAAKRKLDEQTAAAKERNAVFRSGMGQGVNDAFNRAKNVATVGAIGATAVATTAVAQSINVAADFEAQMSKVASKTNATSQEMEKLKSTALSLGASTSLSASETAVAMDSLAASGYSTNNIIGALPGIIAGAEASGEELATVTSVVTSAIAAYGMQAGEASRVSDIMAMAANKSKASVEDLGYSFKYAAPIANTLGIKIEELSAATGILVDKGLAGEQAGTALRMALTRLSSPPKEAQKVLNKLGISVLDSNKKFKSLTTITEEWNKATANLSDTQKLAYADTVFGTEASTAMLNLFKTGPAVINNMTTALDNSSGAAEKAAAIIKENYAGAKDQMMGAYQSAQIAFATPILPVLKDTFSGIGAMIEDNLPAIEAAGETVAGTLENIFAPFIAYNEPIKPEITPDMNHREIEDAMTQYEDAMRKHNLFAPMDMGDKVDYMLDQTVAHVTEWVQGDGGEAMQELFSELAGIAADAWVTSFTSMATGAVGELAEGDVGSALVMGAVANSMTGGLLTAGGLAGGKWLLGKGKDKWDTRRSNKENMPDSNTSEAKSNTKKNTVSKTPPATEPPKATSSKTIAKPIVTDAAATATNVSKGAKFSKVLKGAGKIAVPLAAAGGIIQIATSDNKTEAIGDVAGGLAGGWGGAKIGALIGTAIAPGIGTAIGGALGGIVGGIGGSLLGSKAANAIASPAPANTTATSTATPAPTNATLNTANTQVNNALATFTMSVTTLDTTINNFTSTSLMQLQTTTNSLLNNMLFLVSTTSQANGWITSLQSIQPAAQRVVSALNLLEQRINAIELPGTQSTRRTAYE